MVLLRFVSGILCFGSSLRRTALASWVMLSEGSWRDLVELDAGIDGLDAVACLDACWPVLLELAAVWVVGLEDVLATFPLSAGLLLKKKSVQIFTINLQLFRKIKINECYHNGVCYYFTMKWPAQIHSTVWRNLWIFFLKIYIPWFCSFCDARSSDRWCWRSPRSFDRCFGDSTFTGQLWFSAGCLFSSTNQCSGCRLTWLGDFRDISRWFWFDKLLMKRVFC